MNFVEPRNEDSAHRSHESEPGRRVQINMGPVERTLLVPLWARARESARSVPVLFDPQASKLLEQLDFDPSVLDEHASASQLGCCVRGALVDRWVSEFLTKHPKGTVIEAGCGLNTRFARLDNGLATWVSVDLPDVIALRKKLVRTQARVVELVGSIADKSWLDSVRSSTPGPWFVATEGVLMYLPKPDVIRTVQQIAASLRGGWFAFDVMTPIVLKMQQLHDAMKYFEAQFISSVGSPNEVESWSEHLSLVHSESFYNLLYSRSERLPRWMQLTGPVVAKLWPNIHNVYTINLAKIG